MENNMEDGKKQKAVLEEFSIKTITINKNNTRLVLIGLWIITLFLYNIGMVFSLLFPIRISLNFAMVFPILMVIACLFLKANIVKWLNIIFGCLFAATPFIEIGAIMGYNIDTMLITALIKKVLHDTFNLYNMICIILGILIIHIAKKWPKVTQQ